MVRLLIFCVERNPWDRPASLYYWYNRSEPRQAISDFVDSGALNILKQRGIELYTIGGRIAVDRICSNERLVDEMEFIRDKLGIPGKLALPMAKSGFRKAGIQYRDILVATQREKIAELFSDEIRLYGYKF